jgi:heat shock protein HslJ
LLEKRSRSQQGGAGSQLTGSCQIREGFVQRPAEQGIAACAPTIWREEYAFVSASGATYQVKTRGEVQMLSLEVAGAVTHLDKKERR